VRHEALRLGTLHSLSITAVYPQERLFREREYGPKRSRKQGPADWTVVEGNAATLVECKTIRPNLELVSLESKDVLEEYAQRVAGAVHQLYRHSQAIRRRERGLEDFYGLDFCQELEHLLSLVVKGARLSDLLACLTDEGAIKALEQYQEELQKDAVLSVTKQRANRMMEAITHTSHWS
jgi:hypothetical protein